jgi:hypothetical protein
MEVVEAWKSENYWRTGSKNYVYVMDNAKQHHAKVVKQQLL